MITSLNMSPSKNEISSNIIPEDIIIGSLNPDYNKLRITFVSYAKVYIDNNNIAKHRTVGVIAPIPEKDRGGYYFMSLATSKHIHAFVWT